MSDVFHAMYRWCWNMSEDNQTNRMIDSINTFAQCTSLPIHFHLYQTCVYAYDVYVIVCHQPHLQRVPKIVIFNKVLSIN